MRKWIFIGVVGGLLQFAMVGYVAFSGPEASPKPPKAKSPAPMVRSKPDTGKLLARANPSADSPKKSQTETEVYKPLPIAAGAVEPVPALPPQPPAVAALPTDPSPSVPVPAPARPAPVAAAPASAAPAPAPPPPIAIPADLTLASTEDVIRKVFGKEGDKAVRVARCESELLTSAKNGINLGLFQLGKNERAEYGHGEDALTQIKAAYELFKARGWQPWVCA